MLNCTRPSGKVLSSSDRKKIWAQDEFVPGGYPVDAQSYYGREGNAKEDSKIGTTVDARCLDDRDWNRAEEPSHNQYTVIDQLREGEKKASKISCLFISAYIYK
ncbi:MAG TPA: hypothetical protein VFO40_17605 [Chthoniobacterales bacterium]|nr:hypothetical protein [Chthoniobacterales bacterium]